MAPPFRMYFLFLIPVLRPGLLSLPLSASPGSVGGCHLCHESVEWHTVPSGSAQLLLGHILRGLIYPLMKQWWSREESLFHLAELSVGEMDEKQ